MKIKQNQVHIWRVNLDLDGPSLNNLKNLLSEEELARADRLRFEKQRNRFIAARGLLRRILSRYTGEEPGELEFRYNPNGKPELLNNKVRFNLSHSGDIALYAVTLDKPVGIDVEQIRKDIKYKELMKQYLSEEESNAILGLPEGQQKEAFYRCWTRKEAFAKAKGSSILDVLDKNKDMSDWFIAEVDSPGDSCIAAVALEGQNAEIRCFDDYSPTLKS
jgi:4'-phosphopantetheinyl transferase